MVADLDFFYLADPNRMDASTSRWGRWQHKGAFQTILTHTHIGTLQHNIWVVPTMLPGSIVATRVFVATARLSIVATEVRTFDIVATDIWIRAAPTPVANIERGGGHCCNWRRADRPFFCPQGLLVWQLLMHKRISNIAQRNGRRITFRGSVLWCDTFVESARDNNGALLQWIRSITNMDMELWIGGRIPLQCSVKKSGSVDCRLKQYGSQ